MTTQEVKRKLAAILSADVKGYSRLMGEDEVQTLKTLSAYFQIMTTLIQKHQGKVLNIAGDNLLADFESVVDAVLCGVEVQKGLRTKNAELAEGQRVEFRIGINLGDVIREGENIYGDGVNIAERVQGLADGEGICISGTAYDQVENKLGLGYEYLGEQSVKNIAKPVRVYRVLMEPEAAGKVIGAKKAKPKRWQRAAIGLVVAVIVVAAAFVIWRLYLHPALPLVEVASKEKMAFPLPDKPSIAVLPFTNMSGDPKQDYFSDGLTEQVITSLSKFQRLFVIARNSTFVYKGKPVKIQKVAEDLGVQYVLEGSVQKSGDRVRITAQLIDALTGRHIWSEQYDRELKDIFVLQDEITIKIMNGMSIELTEGEQARRWTKGGTDNLKALEKHYQGLAFGVRGTKEDNDRARQLYEEAIALDPKFVWAYVYLGFTYFFEVRYGWSESPVKSLQMAFGLAQKALAMDDSDDGAHSLLAGIYLVKREYDKALSEAERAVALNPNGADAYIGLAGIVGCLARWEESVLYAKKSIRLSPFPGFFYYWILGRAYFMTGQFDESIVTWKKTLQVSPDFLSAHAFLAACYSSMGRDAEATAAAKEVLRINPKFTIESYAKTIPYKDKADIEREVAALRKAGLPEKPPIPLPDKRSIAVLPFVNMSEDKSQEYFSDGLTEEIITALSKTPKLFVIARNSSFVYKGKPVNVQQVSRELGVKYVLEGSVRRSGDQLRITAQLIDAITGNHLWAERYDRELKDIFAMQDEITLKVTSTLNVKLTDGEIALFLGKGTKNLEAYLKMIQARELVTRGSKEDNAQGKKLIEEVITLDPSYAMAYAYLAMSYFYDVAIVASQSPGESIARGIEMAQKAVSLDQKIAFPHGVLAQFYHLKKDWDKAVSEAEIGVALEPNSAYSYGLLGSALIYSSRYKEAISAYEKSIRLDPFPSMNTLIGYANALRMIGRYEESVATFKKLIQWRPDNLLGHIGLTGTLSMMGRDADAQAQAKEVLRINPNFSVEGFSKRTAYKNMDDWNRYMDALRKAGLK